jgi:hypothetical protein
MAKYFFNRYYLVSRMVGRAFLCGIVILSLSSWCFTSCAKQEKRIKKPAQVSPRSAAQESKPSKGIADLSTAIERVTDTQEGGDGDGTENAYQRSSKGSLHR